MAIQRPDLSSLDPAVLAYIESLEAEVDTLRAQTDDDGGSARSDAPAEPSEPPTSLNLITISADGFVKRTARHQYLRQRRSGMGIFDLESNVGDPPAFLVVADESAGLVVVSNQARAFRVQVNALPEAAIRARGQQIQTLAPSLQLRAGEKLALIFPDSGGQFLTLVSERGQIRRFASQGLGPKLQPGTVLYDTREGGAPAAYCWSSGTDEIFIATKLGKAIRFGERQVPVRGCLGMRVDPDDRVVGVAATSAEGGVFMATHDGKGTIRLLTTFSANKEPGSGGKAVMKTDALIGAAAVNNKSDIFIISQLGKIIRFQAAEVPPKESVVQGVNCMALRSDECSAMTACVVG